MFRKIFRYTRHSDAAADLAFSFYLLFQAHQFGTIEWNYCRRNYLSFEEVQVLNCGTKFVFLDKSFVYVLRISVQLHTILVRKMFKGNTKDTAKMGKICSKLIMRDQAMLVMLCKCLFYTWNKFHS